jgi:Flp pilus assembly protein protease CpaA
MQCVVVLILAWISLVDLRTHRITNKAVMVLAIASLATTAANSFTYRDHFFMAIIVLLVAILLSVFCGLGMGDVKLLGVLAMLVLPPQAATYKIFLFTIAVTAMAHAIFLSQGDFRRSLQIPLAPAIFCGTIATLIVK